MKHNHESLRNLPIGIFDSGVGGLTVLKSLIQHCPKEKFIYLGDTARLPYGIKSQETISKYALQATKWLIQRSIKLLVVACNTATTLALPVLKKYYPNIPIVGVVEPGAQMVCHSTKNRHIVVIGTDATIQSEGYEKAIKAIDPTIKVVAKSCQLFVYLAEEGWHQTEVSRLVAKEYLEEIFLRQAPSPDTLLLGCTHFPLLTSSIKQVIGNNVNIINSADATTFVIKKLLNERNMDNCSSASNGATFFVTDAPARFTRVAQYFLGYPILPQSVELIDLAIL